MLRESTCETKGEKQKKKKTNRISHCDKTADSELLHGSHHKAAKQFHNSRNDREDSESHT